MNLYECIFIGRQDLSQQQVEALGVSLGLLISQNGGGVARSEYCGFRTLAYPVKKNHKGHYYIMQIKAPAAAIAELDRTMKINEDVVRFLIVRVQKFDDKDNLITQVKSFSDDSAAGRGDRDRRAYHRSFKNASDDVDQAEKSPDFVDGGDLNAAEIAPHSEDAADR